MYYFCGMKASELAQAIMSHLEFEPIDQQLRFIAVLADFVCNHTPNGVLVLNGYAGSGKTSIMGALIKALAEKRHKTVTLAPTGRAAKVAAGFSGGKASTIHRRIFRADSVGPDARFVPAPNLDRKTIFICDEASMVTDSVSRSDSLLALMLAHVYSGQGNALILVGDIAQLPPVGMSESPAMNVGRLRSFGLDPISFTLDISMRQEHGGGILSNATNMRQLMMAALPGMRPQIDLRGFDDVRVISSEELADELSASWSEVGVENTIIITRSNSRANKYNMAIRNLVMMAEEPLQRGDRLVISKNDYYWSRINKLGTFIANGDMAEVQWVGKTEKLYGRFFTDVELYFPASDLRVGTKVMLRSLVCEGPSLPREELDRFYTHALAEQEGTLSQKIVALREDPFYNALQVKYGYCVTCHKAQGGQWNHVYIDMSGIDPESLDETFYRWIYTAITRATQRVYFINPTIKVRN